MKMVKLVLIGFIITLLRAMIQTVMPAGQQTVLPPSMFISNGSMPIVFILYGTFAYTMIAAIYLLIHKNLGGNRIIKGLKFGISCSLVWIMYLMEPLPHAPTIDIAYLIADSAVLVAMGVLLGRFMSKSTQPAKKYKFTRHSLLSIGMITALFFTGRIIEYTIFHIYSSFDIFPLYSILWVVASGIVIGLIFDYINPFIENKRIITKSFQFGFIIFGVDLFAFNFFIPIVFNFDLKDLFIRTIMDIIFVFIGSYILNKMKKRETANL